jgi:hypothetical protein
MSYNFQLFLNNKLFVCSFFNHLRFSLVNLLQLFDGKKTFRILFCHEIDTDALIWIQVSLQQHNLPDGSNLKTEIIIFNYN